MEIRPATAEDTATGGLDIRPDRWKPTQDRRSLVAVVDGEVVGRCLAQDNEFHPGSRVCEVEVLPAWRRRGIGTALVRAMAGLSPLPLRFKVHEDDAALRGLCTALGAVTTQMCPPWRRVVDDDLLAWADAHRGAVDPVADDDLDELLELWVHHYVAQHATWSPAAPVDALRELQRDEFSAGAVALDQKRSFVVREGVRIVAASLVWTADDLVEVTPVCDRFGDPSRRVRMEACLAATIQATTPGDGLAVDCHLTNAEEYAMVTAIGSVTDDSWTALALVPSTVEPRPRGLSDEILTGRLAWAGFRRPAPDGHA